MWCECELARSPCLGLTRGGGSAALAPRRSGGSRSRGSATRPTIVCVDAVTRASDTCGRLLAWAVRHLKAATLASAHGPVLEIQAKLLASIDRELVAADLVKQEEDERVAERAAVSEAAAAQLKEEEEGQARSTTRVSAEDAPANVAARQQNEASDGARVARRAVPRSAVVDRSVQLSERRQRLEVYAPAPALLVQPAALHVTQRRLVFGMGSAALAAVHLSDLRAVAMALDGNRAKILIQGFADGGPRRRTGGGGRGGALRRAGHCGRAHPRAGHGPPGCCGRARAVPRDPGGEGGRERGLWEDVCGAGAPGLGRGGDRRTARRRRGAAGHVRRRFPSRGAHRRQAQLWHEQRKAERCARAVGVHGPRGRARR